MDVDGSLRPTLELGFQLKNTRGIYTYGCWSEPEVYPCTSVDLGVRVDLDMSVAEKSEGPDIIFQLTSKFREAQVRADVAVSDI